MLFKAKH